MGLLESEVIMEYRSAIVDELGNLVAWCCELSESEKERILDDHPEYTISCIPCEGDGYPAYNWG